MAIIFLTFSYREYSIIIIDISFFVEIILFSGGLPAHAIERRLNLLLKDPSLISIFAAN